MTAREIAEKYVYGNHDAKTDKQEIEDMIKDINASYQQIEDYALFCILCDKNGLNLIKYNDFLKLMK